MTGPEELVPRDPVGLTLPLAQNLIFDNRFDAFSHSSYETQTIRDINMMLEDCGMIGDYEVNTSLAFVVPEDTTPDDEGNVQVIRMDMETDFVGELLGGRSLKIGKLIGHHSIRAVCLTFQDVLIRTRQSVQKAVIPQYEKIADDERMYVPVFAVNEINPTS